MSAANALHSVVRKREPFYVVSHERSGTHLAMNLCYRNLHIAQDFHDFRGWRGPYEQESGREAHWRRTAEDWLSRRDRAGLVKSHCEASVFEKFLPPAKVVYVLRDPRDTLVSFFHYLNSEEFHIHNAAAGDQRCADFSEFLRRPLSDFLRHEFSGNGAAGNVMERWAAHARGWLDARNVLVVRYEDMLGDWRRMVRAVAWHVRAVPKLRMVNFSFGESGAILPRKGIAGDWKNHFAAGDLTDLNSVLRSYGLSLES